MSRPVGLEPARERMISEVEVSANAEDKRLVSSPPIVTESDLRFGPHEHGLVGETPSVENILRLIDKAVCGPQVEVRLVSGKLGDGKRRDFRRSQCGVMVVRRCPASLG